MTLIKHSLWDTMHIKWTGSTLNMNDKRIDLPENVNVPLWDKIKVRALMPHENARYNIMIKQGNTWYAPRNESRNLPIYLTSGSLNDVHLTNKSLFCLDISVTMARSSYSSNPLTTPPPPPIVGMEVSARWKITWKGEVIMTIVMPDDVVDTDSICEDIKRTHWTSDGSLDVMFLEENMELHPPL